MVENWYALEEHARDRIAEAQAAARSQALTQELAPARCSPCSLALGFIHRASAALARALA